MPPGTDTSEVYLVIRSAANGIAGEIPCWMVGAGRRCLETSKSVLISNFIEVRQHGDRCQDRPGYRSRPAVKEILRFFTFASQFAHTFFYKSKAVAVSDDKEQERRERQARYEAWCIGTVLPMFRSLQGTSTEKFRQMKEWLNAQGRPWSSWGPGSGYLRAEVESLIYNARKFERAAKKNINSNSEIPSEIVVMNDAAGGDAS